MHSSNTILFSVDRVEDYTNVAGKRVHGKINYLCSFSVTPESPNEEGCNMLPYFVLSSVSNRAQMAVLHNGKNTTRDIIQTEIQDAFGTIKLIVEDFTLKRTDAQSHSAGQLSESELAIKSEPPQMQ